MNDKCLSLSLSSLDPSDLKSLTYEETWKGDFFLCGNISLVDEIEWFVCQFDGKELRLANGEKLSDFQKERMEFSPDGINNKFLIFRLPPLACQSLVVTM